MVSPAQSLRREVAGAIAALPINVKNVVDALLRLQRDKQRLREVVTMALQIVRHFGEGRLLLRSELVRFFADHAMFEAVFANARSAPIVAPAMQTVPGLSATCNLPRIPSLAELSSWLGLYDDELAAWTRTLRGDGARRDARYRHYHEQWIPRRGAPPRLIEAPKSRLKEVQRRVAVGLLRHVPIHAAAHGFVRGRSVQSCVAPHVGSRCVLRMDLEDCFASVGRGRVLRTFVNTGYPEDVSIELARLCTTATPASELAGLVSRSEARAVRLREKLRVPHLPQGAPSSPGLMNLAAYRIDARLTGLAKRFGAVYSRYGDDLIFSGDDHFRRDAVRCARYAAAILLEDRFDVAHHKTRIMCRSQAQRCLGLVVNERAALPRKERQLLEAILYNCMRHGPETQNHAGVADFEAHLRGRVAHASQHGEAERLVSLLAQIRWSE